MNKFVSEKQYEPGDDFTPRGFHSLKRIDHVFVHHDGRIVITGAPGSDDEAHNCDFAGCSSVEDVLLRGRIDEGHPVPPKEDEDA